jgi:hypothetical protein
MGDRLLLWRQMREDMAQEDISTFNQIAQSLLQGAKRNTVLFATLLTTVSVGARVVSISRGNLQTAASVAAAAPLQILLTATVHYAYLLIATLGGGILVFLLLYFPRLARHQARQLATVAVALAVVMFFLVPIDYYQVMIFAAIWVLVIGNLLLAQDLILFAGGQKTIDYRTRRKAVRQRQNRYLIKNGNLALVLVLGFVISLDTRVWLPSERIYSHEQLQVMYVLEENGESLVALDDVERVVVRIDRNDLVRREFCQVHRSSNTVVQRLLRIPQPSYPSCYEAYLSPWFRLGPVDSDLLPQRQSR